MKLPIAIKIGLALTIPVTSCGRVSPPLANGTTESVTKSVSVTGLGPIPSAPTSVPNQVPAASAISTPPGIGIGGLLDLVSLPVGTVQASGLVRDPVNNGVWVWTSSNELSSIELVTRDGHVAVWSLGSGDQDRIPAVPVSIVARDGLAYVLVNSGLYVVNPNLKDATHYVIPVVPPNKDAEIVNGDVSWNPPISLAISANYLAIGYAASGTIQISSISAPGKFSSFTLGEHLIGLSMKAFAPADVFIAGLADLNSHSANVIQRFTADGKIISIDVADSRVLINGDAGSILAGVGQLVRFSSEGGPSRVGAGGLALDEGHPLVAGSDPSVEGVQVGDTGYIVGTSRGGTQTVVYPPAKNCGAPSVPQGAEGMPAICNLRPVSSIFDENGLLWSLFNPDAGQFVVRTVQL
jgi:hypothetical protein